MKRHVYYLIIKNFNFINNNYLSSQTSEHNNTKNGILAWERYTMWHSGLGKVCNVAFWLGKGIQCGGLNRLMGCHVNTFGLWKPFIGRLIIV
jgi:hypothetical protein